MKPETVHRWCLSLAAATLFLIAAGGLVTSTGSGLSVPDWPLSYGQLMPPMIGGIRFEHSHRMIAGFVGLFTVAVAAVLWMGDRRAWVKRLGLVAVAAVTTQAILGGLTVIYLLPKPVSIAHACLAQSFFSLCVGLAYFTSREWLAAPRSQLADNGKLKRLAVLTAGLAFGQLVLGACVRHEAGDVIAWHVILAFAVLIHASMLVSRASADDAAAPLQGHAVAFGALVVVQIFLGIGAFVFSRMLGPTSQPRVGDVLFSTAHQTLGAVILATAVLFALRAFRIDVSRTAASAAPAGEGV